MAVPAEASRVAAEASMPKWKRFIVLVSSRIRLNQLELIETGAHRVAPARRERIGHQKVDRTSDHNSKFARSKSEPSRGVEFPRSRPWLDRLAFRPPEPKPRNTQ